MPGTKLLLLFVLIFLPIGTAQIGVAHDGDPDHNRADEAIAQTTEALKEEPNDPKLLSQRAFLYLKQWEYESALADIDRALQLDPDTEAYQFTRGYARFMLADWKGALADFDKVCASDTKIPGPWFYRGELRWRLGDLQGAKADLDKAHDLVAQRTKKPYLRGLLVRGRVLAAQGDTKGALADLTRAIDADGRYEDALVERAKLLAKTDWAAASRDLETLKDMFPTHAVVLATEARLQHDRNGMVTEQYEKAVQAYVRDSKFARSPSRKAELLLEAARLRADFKDVWGAIELVEDARQIAPDRVDLHRLRVELFEHADGVKPAVLEDARTKLKAVEASHGVAPVGSGR
jgi:tetratricopeptide (TPR) repeat protein